MATAQNASNGSGYFIGCICRYILPLVIQFMVQESIFPPSVSSFCYSLKQNIHGKQSSCQRAKCKSCCAYTPMSPSTGHWHFVHVNLTQKIASLMMWSVLGGSVELVLFSVFGGRHVNDADTGTYIAGLVHTYLWHPNKEAICVCV